MKLPYYKKDNRFENATVILYKYVVVNIFINKC